MSNTINSVVEIQSEYNGMKYKVIFSELGHRCGYVQIPKGNKNFEVNYDDVTNSIGGRVTCHGGLTFSGFFEDGSWWIGFDCAHCDDKMDIESLKKYFPNSIYIKIYEVSNYQNFGDIRNVEYVECECKYIIDQLI